MPFSEQSGTAIPVAGLPAGRQGSACPATALPAATRQPLASLGFLGLLRVLGAPAAASTATYCPDDSLRAHPPQVNFRVDNDLFGGKAQDQGYSNGAQLTLVSPNLLDYTDDPCLPKPARWINRHLEQLHAGRFDQ